MAKDDQEIIGRAMRLPEAGVSARQDKRSFLPQTIFWPFWPFLPGSVDAV
jgi:hypothetical protein